MIKFAAILVALLGLGFPAWAQPVCNPAIPNADQCLSPAASLSLTDILRGTQSQGPNRPNQTVKIPLSTLAPALFSSPSFGPAVRAVAPALTPATPTTIGGIKQPTSVAHQWISGIGNNGSPILTQPAFGDISGSIGLGQLPTIPTTQISGLAASATTDTTNATNITTGTIPAGPLTGANASGANVTATGTSTARTAANRAADLVNVRDRGAKGDGKIGPMTVATVAGSPTLIVGSNTFSAADVGKWVVVGNAGDPATNFVGGNMGPVTSIPVTLAGGGYASVPSCSLTDSSGSGSNNTCSAVMALQSATVATGGTCTNGTWTFFATQTGNLSPAQVTGTVSGGALTGTLTLVSGGQYSSLSGITLSSGECTVMPTATFSWGIGFIQTSSWGNNGSVTGDNSYKQATTSAALSGGTPSVAATLGTPIVTVVIPPWVGIITAYTSPTTVTLSTNATTAISTASTMVAIGTDDSHAIGQAYTDAQALGTGVYFPAGTFFSMTDRLNSGNLNMTTRGAGMYATTIFWEAGASNSFGQIPGWLPLFGNYNNGSPSAPLGNFQLEDLTIRGTFDFGRINTGGDAVILNYYKSILLDRVNFTQISKSAIASEGAKEFRVIDSVFDTIARSSARCRGCFYYAALDNYFMHTDDDAVDAHQANFAPNQGPGAVREGVLVTGNHFVDSTCVHIIGGRDVDVHDNYFDRCKVQAVALGTDATEGVNPMFNINVHDNVATNTLCRPPFSCSAGNVFAVFLNPPAASSVDAKVIPGGSIQGTASFLPPWNYYLNNVYTGTAGAPSGMGINIHDNTVTRTLPSVSAYSQWGYGKAFSYVGFLDTPITDAGMVPTAGVAVTPFAVGMNIHHNQLNDVARGISISGTMTFPSMQSLLINYNSFFNTTSGGIYDTSTGVRVSKIDHNIFVNDPYGISPGRSGGHGGWASGYSGSNCIQGATSSITFLEDNYFSQCYTPIAGASTVLARHNSVAGIIDNSRTGAINTWSSINFGVGLYPALGEGYGLIPTQADPTSAWTSVGAGATGHPNEAAAQPSTNLSFKFGERVKSTDPTTGCAEWVRLTSTSANNVAGTDWKCVPLQ